MRNLAFGSALGSSSRVGDESDPRPSRLYVGAPGAEIEGQYGAGEVLSFTLPAGDDPQAEEPEEISYASDAIGGRPAERAGFGDSISVNQGIVAAGSYRQPVGDVDAAGEVVVMSTSAKFEPYTISQATPHFPGTAEEGDLFGFAVHVTPAVGGAAPQLLIGVPGEAIGDIDNAGTVDVVPLSASTGRPDGTIVGWDQDSPKMAGTVEADDRFGAAVSSVLVDDKLTGVVGTPSEAVGDKDYAGMVQTIGTGRGWTQDTSGVPGTAELGDEMGATLAASADGTSLLIGVPGENDEFGAVLSNVVAGDSPADIWGSSRDEPVAYGEAIGY